MVLIKSMNYSGFLKVFLVSEKKEIPLLKKVFLLTVILIKNDQ